MKRFLRGFYYAARGIVSCLKTERNMRVHFCAAFYVLIFAEMFGLGSGGKALLFLTIGSVIAAEAMNTAVESAVDLVSPEKHPLAELAKDAAAGAVLVTAIAAVCVGAALFWDADKLKELGGSLISSKPAVISLAASAAVWLYIITRPCGRNAAENKDKEK